MYLNKETLFTQPLLYSHRRFGDCLSPSSRAILTGSHCTTGQVSLLTIQMWSQNVKYLHMYRQLMQNICGVLTWWNKKATPIKDDYLMYLLQAPVSRGDCSTETGEQHHHYRWYCEESSGRKSTSATLYGYLTYWLYGVVTDGSNPKVVDSI